MFGKTWEAATGTVVESRVTGASVAEHGSSVRREFVVEVVPAAGAPYRAAVKEGNYSDFWHPRPGQRVLLQIEAKSGKVRFDRSDPGLSFKEHERRTSAAFDAALDPDTPPPAG
ncbi:hypothetical protein C6I20_04485 [Aeromicrobium sp. A1-2]|uniref:hypothetical protein n=1 Tax=Aeromicrobium sp. A1-2 TaxID=2107713 RepID=UPI000E474A9A|nr:hypothetical protein [Aeromicrobium sp. A1-2]AXT84526.1 hypothetical protein C6I20_04485 [Aeromicrobium sp. A1-2]